jgi:hypothetical protein
VWDRHPARVHRERDAPIAVVSEGTSFHFLNARGRRSRARLERDTPMNRSSQRFVATNMILLGAATSLASAGSEVFPESSQLLSPSPRTQQNPPRNPMQNPRVRAAGFQPSRGATLTRTGCRTHSSFIRAKVHAFCRAPKAGVWSTSVKAPGYPRLRVRTWLLGPTSMRTVGTISFSSA